MTFYNVISGILFICACQTFLVKLGTPAMWVAATLMAVILNESMLTSDLIERDHNPVVYKLEMKLLDFVGFTVLLWALLIINPIKNGLDVDVSRTLLGADNPRWFWALLAVYWILTIWWNQMAGQLKSTVWSEKFLPVMRSMWLVPVVVGLVNWNVTDFALLPAWAGFVTFATVVAYLSAKPFARV